MMSKRLPLTLVLSAVLFVTASFAATKKGQRNNRSRDWNNSAVVNEDLPRPGNSVYSGNSDWASSGTFESPGSSLILGRPGTPDNWNGGFGNWSDKTAWSEGLPGPGSDVVIYTGNTDYVYLDVSSVIDSMTLGGPSGSESVIVDNSGAQTLIIADSLTVGRIGFLDLVSGSTVEIGGNVLNIGFIFLNNGSTMSIGGNFDNQGQLWTT